MTQPQGPHVLRNTGSILVTGVLVALLSAPAHPAGGMTTDRVSVGPGGLQANGASTTHPDAVSDDGRYVAFTSTASNLVSGDANGVSDVFVRDEQTGVTERISVASDGTEGNASSQLASISADGRFVSFASDASNLVPGDTNGTTDVFVRDRMAGTTVRVSVSSVGVQGNLRSAANSGPHISGNGQFVVFPSIATNLVSNDNNNSNDVFIHDLHTGTTERVSVATGGSEGHLTSAWPHVSDDGRYVVFSSAAPDLVADDTNDTWDIFLRDRQQGTTERISIASDGTQANRNSGYACVSADGRYIAFFSYASNLVPNDTNNMGDIFVRDRLFGTTERASIASDGTQGIGPDLEAGLVSLSADGRYVAFFSRATNLVSDDSNNASDVFVHDRFTGETIRGSVLTDGSEANGSSVGGVLSGNGRRLVFSSVATNLVPGDSNSASDVFLRNLTSCGTPTLQFTTNLTEASELAGVATVSIVRSACAGDTGTVSVDYSTFPGSASPGSDYTPSSGTITFTGTDSLPQIITIPILDDTTFEPTEAFTVGLSNVIGYGMLGSPSVVTVRIIDCEQTLQLSAAAVSVSEAAGMATVLVTREGCGAGTGAVSVDYSTSPGSATPGADYTPVSGTITFGDGDTSPKTIQIPLIDDTELEGPETVLLSLSNPTGGGLLGNPSSTTLTIDDCETKVHFSASSYAVLETAGSAMITVTRAGCMPDTGVVTVDYSTSPGTATPDSDYVPVSGTIIIDAGEDSGTFAVPILSDLQVEPSETVSLNLAHVTGSAYLDSPSAATLIILPCDQSLQLSASAVSVSEAAGSATITVVRTGCTGESVSVDYSTTPGTATPGLDYTPVSGTITFNDGDGAPKTIQIPLLDDDIVEPAETVFLTLSNVTGPALLGSPGSMMVEIADCEEIIEFEHYAYEATEMSKSASIGVVRKGCAAGTGAVQVSFSTADGTAKSGLDYRDTWGTLYFADGEVGPKAFTVPIVDDGKAEMTETLRLSLSDAIGSVSLGDIWSSTLSIMDHVDPTPTRRGGGHGFPRQLGAPEVELGLWVPEVYAFAPQTNPGRGFVEMTLDLPEESEVDIRVFDVSGRQIQRLAGGFLEAGRYRVRWDGTDAGGRSTPMGMYFLRAACGLGVRVSKVLILR